MHVPDRIAAFRNLSRQTLRLTKHRLQTKATRVRGKQQQVSVRLLAIPAVQLAARTVAGLGTHDASHMAAGIAYYAILSLFPLILGLIAVFGLILPSETVQEDLFDFFRENLPGYVDELQTNIDNVIGLRGTLGVLSVIGLFWSASAMFGAISRGINRAWDIHIDRPFLVRKALELGMALGVGLLFLLSLGASSILTILSSADVAAVGAAVQFGARVVALLLSLVIFLLLYKFIPNTRTSWQHAWPGAVLAAVLFEGVKSLFVLYLAHFANYEAVYGSVGSIIALLVWIYISAFILMLGAEFSHQYGLMKAQARSHPSHFAGPGNLHRGCP
jgi:membrane protein